MALNSNALTTLAMAKSWLKIPTLEVGLDPLVELWINAASDDIERFTMRKLKAQAVTEYHHGRNSNMILAREYPVNSITELRLDQESLFTDADTLIDSADYRITDDFNSVVLVSGRMFPKGYHNIRLIYNAGFATVPSNLEQACLWIVAYTQRIWETKNIGRPNKSKDGESASYSQDWPPHIVKTLMQFKRSEFPNLDSPVANV